MSGTIDQLLFGYDDGHALVDGSRRLSPAQLLDVLPHVDAALQRPDERQVVGTWVPSVGRYLLARIWAAPERRRPGAVWSHALLLTPEQLAAEHLCGLDTLLRRPAEDGVVGYDRPLAWPAQPPSSLAPPRLARAVAEAAAGADRRPSVVLWADPLQAETALLRLFDLLSGPMRRALSFRSREQARAVPSPYRIQIAASLGGAGVQPEVRVIDAREPAGADDRSRA